MRVFLEVFVIVFVQFFLKIHGSSLNVYSKLAVSLCMSEPFYTTVIRTASEDKVMRSLKRICQGVHVYQNDPLNSSTMDPSIFLDFDACFETEIRRSRGKPTLKLEFRNLIAKLNSKEISDLFLHKPKKVGKPLVFNCSNGFEPMMEERKSEGFTQYLVGTSTEISEPKVPVKMNIKIHDESQSKKLKIMSTVYIMEIIIAQIDMDIMVFVPFLEEEQQIFWKASLLVRNMVGHVYIQTQRWSREKILKIITQKNVLYFYHQEGDVFVREISMFHIGGNGGEIPDFDLYKTHVLTDSSHPSSFVKTSMKLLKRHSTRFFLSPKVIMLSAISVGLLLAGCSLGSENLQDISESIISHPQLSRLLNLSVEDFMAYLQSNVSALNDVILFLVEMTRTTIPDASLSVLSYISSELYKLISGS